MKPIDKNRFLSAAIVLSVLAHAALLAVRFAAPDTFRLQPASPELEVILVNARHAQKPLTADALAQANLDGGGNASTGRAKSPLPDMHKSVDGDSMKASKRRIEELEEQQRKLLTQLTKKVPFVSASKQYPGVQKDISPESGETDAVNSTHVMTRREAEIAKNIEDYNKRPKKTQITPSTREVGYAMYYKALQERIEKIGTLNFPQQDGKKIYGELVIYIPIAQDGTIYEKEGGPRVERSAGNLALDRAALRIVRRAAPFGKFPPNMRSADKDEVWEVVTRFKFTKDDALEAQLRGGNE